MVIQETNEAEGADDFEPDKSYKLQVRTGHEDPDLCKTYQEFEATFLDLKIGAQNQLFAKFKGRHEIDVRFIIFPVKLA